jgi:hypothetical protein
MENENLVKLFKKELKDEVVLNTNSWKEYKITDLFNVKGSKTTPKLQLIEL